jgi:hypothetical protein
LQIAPVNKDYACRKLKAGCLRPQAMIKIRSMKTQEKIRNSAVVLLLLLAILAQANTIPRPLSQEVFYSSAWSRIDSLEKLGLPKSALAQTEAAYAAAAKDQNTGQMLKAIMLRLKFEIQINSSLQPALSILHSEIDRAVFPEANILHSMLAEAYWSYFQAERWRFYGRSQAAAQPGSPVSQWPIQQILDSCKAHYSLSLANKSALQNIAAEKYSPIIKASGQKAELRPSLYDFLAFRAIDFFANQESGITNPKDQHCFTGPELFQPAPVFMKASNNAPSSSATAITLDIYRSLLLSLTERADSAALLDADMHRLDFALRTSTGIQAPAYYRKALAGLQENFAKLPNSAGIWLKIAQNLHAEAGNYQAYDTASLKYANYINKTRAICQQAASLFPGTEGANACIKILDAVNMQELSFRAEEFIPAGKTFAAHVRYRNTPNLHFMAASISEENYRDISGLCSSGRYTGPNCDSSLVAELFAKSVPVERFAMPMPGACSGNLHAAEVLFSGLPVGRYIMAVSGTGSFSAADSLLAVAAFSVTNLAFLHRDKNRTADVRVIGRADGMPVSGAELRIYEHSWRNGSNTKKLASAGKTGRLGQCQIKLGAIQGSYSIEVNSKADKFTPSEQFYSYTETHRETPRQELYIFTDRAAYRPGQAVYFKAVLFSREGNMLQALPGRSLQLSLYDAAGNTAGSLDASTNSFGSVAGSFTIPSNLMAGSFSISGAHGSASFIVEEYKRPSIEIVPGNSSDVLCFGLPADIKGQARSYAGAALPGQNISYIIEQLPWPGIYRQGAGQAALVHSGATVTDSAGLFSFSFAPAAPCGSAELEPGCTRYRITARVADSGGESQEAAWEVSACRVPMRIEIEAPEIALLSSLPAINASLLLHDGTPQSFSGGIRLYKLQDYSQAYRPGLWPVPDMQLYSPYEWGSRYPGNRLAHENSLQQRPVEKLEAAEACSGNNGCSIDMSKIKGLKPGLYLAEAYSMAGCGKTASGKAYFRIIDSNSKKPAITEPLFISQLTGSCLPGQAARFLLSASGKANVLVEVENNGNIESASFISLSGEQRIVDVPVSENYRGNFAVHFRSIIGNRLYSSSYTVNVPYKNTVLQIELAGIGSLMRPGSRHDFNIELRDEAGLPVEAEFAALMYDASVDKFAPLSWPRPLHSYRSPQLGSRAVLGAEPMVWAWRRSRGHGHKAYDTGHYPALNWHGAQLGMQGSLHKGGQAIRHTALKSMSAPNHLPAMGADMAGAENFAINEQSMADSQQEAAQEPARTDFAETAFFYAQLKTGPDGRASASFLLPQSLTRWKFMGMAHTAAGQSGYISFEAEARKELMLQANMPRFFREGDTVSIAARISNLSGRDVSGTASFLCRDAIGGGKLNLLTGYSAAKPFGAAHGQTDYLHWPIAVPGGVSAVGCAINAEAGALSDAEYRFAPVLGRMELRTESVPVYLNNEGIKDFNLPGFADSIRQQNIVTKGIVAELSSNPAWYAIKALPRIGGSQSKNADAVFERYFANSIALKLIADNPQIQAAAAVWLENAASLSPLAANEDLKQLGLARTPWASYAAAEHLQAMELAQLLNINNARQELNGALQELAALQCPGGSWPWFPGMGQSRHTTIRILSGLGQLRAIGAGDFPLQMAKSAAQAADIWLDQDYKQMRRGSLAGQRYSISHWQIELLHARSFFAGDVPIDKNSGAYAYYIQAARETWNSHGPGGKALIASALHRLGDKTTPGLIINSLNETCAHSNELGIYWPSPEGISAQIEDHAYIIAAYNELAADDTAINGMKVWLLKNKQVTSWGTGRATAKAVYALLGGKGSWIAAGGSAELYIGGKDIRSYGTAQQQGASGYTRAVISAAEVPAGKADIRLINHTGKPVWGAVHWQYLAPVDELGASQGGITISKSLFLVSASGEAASRPLSAKDTIALGQQILVRLQISTDRDMDFMHLKDSRPAGAEPQDAVSGYKYGGGMGYYMEIRDTETNFFINRLAKGHYVIEYKLAAAHKGSFAAGPASLQSIYAPEFSAHAAGARISID